MGHVLKLNTIDNPCSRCVENKCVTCRDAGIECSDLPGEYKAELAQLRKAQETFQTIKVSPLILSMAAEKFQTVMSELSERACAWAEAESLHKKQEEEERKQKELAEEQEKHPRQKEKQVVLA
ncbi:hypothetical protein KEM55_005640 [Ascosphaera atra]|nr:hypothetical protein KEM55_005640 [Ascosphaera atra]